MGNSFVNQYYTVLQHNTKLMHRFYQDRSVLTHGGPESNKVETVTSLKDIHNKVIQLGLDGARAEISSVDSQYSHEGGVIVQVVGGLTMKDGTKPHAKTNNTAETTTTPTATENIALASAVDISTSSRSANFPVAT